MPRADAGGGVHAEIVAVGTELLLGDGVDTNSSWLSARLVELGVDVRRHTVVGDGLDDIAAALGRAVAEHDLVVTTGGLGPTQDDRTRYAVARVADVDLERHGALAARTRAYFERRGRTMPERNLLQADLPRGAVPIPAAGTAPGFALEVGGALVICLPGVPREMQQMTDAHVVPMVQRRAGLHVTVSRLVRTAGIAESAVAERCAALDARLSAAGEPELAYLASRAETRVRVTGRAPDRGAALALVDPVVDELVTLLSPHVVGLDDEGTEHAVARQLRRRSWSLAVGESVTGGGVGARIVTVPGASGWFAGGVVAYATEAKSDVAGVDPAVLDAHGPVSEPTAAALAAGARDRFGADVGLGVVGVAGPDPQGGRPVGTICLAAALPGRPTRTRTVALPPRSRRDMQEFAASIALDFLRRRLVDDAVPD